CQRRQRWECSFRRCWSSRAKDECKVGSAHPTDCYCRRVGTAHHDDQTRCHRYNFRKCPITAARLFLEGLSSSRFACTSIGAFLQTKPTSNCCETRSIP